MHEVLVNRLVGLSLPRKSLVRLTDHRNVTIGFYLGRKTTSQINFLYTPFPVGVKSRLGLKLPGQFILSKMLKTL